ncbi:MAG: endolytic transglycosylase MltG [Actinomycetota bacterium]
MSSGERLSPAAPKRSKLGRRIFLTVLGVAVLVTLGTAGYVRWAFGGTERGTQVSIVVPNGATTTAIADLLASGGVVRSAFVFRLAARFQGVETEFKSGEYKMRTGLGISEAIRLLRKGVVPETVRFTVPEGKTVGEVAKIVEAETHISAKDFIAAATSGRITPGGFGAPAGNLEGFLFPKTYEVRVKATAEDVVAMMVRQFEREVAGLGVAQAARALGITPYQVVVVAGMIEREAKVERDRPLVASVIYNRLRIGMRLQIDATVQYAFLLRDGSYKTRLLYSDLEINSPFNTYKIPALPPAPIASPGLAALRAAFAPASSDFLYYVLSKDGRSHCFARDNAGFQRCRSAA